MEYFLTIIIIIFVVLFVLSKIKRIVIFDFECGVRYNRGRFQELLLPGLYWYIPFFTTISKIDKRPKYVSVQGQEVLSSDGVSLKVSLSAKYQISDPVKAINACDDFRDALYAELQIALREIVGGTTIDRLLETRNEISKTLFEKTEAISKDLGLTLMSVSIKDIMMPGPLKEIFSKIVQANKEGQAALERARGETAALRNLANAAKMLESNPHLFQLRILQSLGESKGNTIVFGSSAFEGVMPAKKTTNNAPESTQ